MGERPSPQYTLERIDNNQDYNPENCKWANRTTQNRNTRGNRFITFNGQTLTIAEWSERLKVSPHLLSTRLNKHKWTIERALSTPVRLQKTQQQKEKE
jgi:hypothetical protein